MPRLDTCIFAREEFRAMTAEPPQKPLDTWDKALRINLDRRWYGTFAEIGGGQEGLTLVLSVSEEHPGPSPSPCPRTTWP
jgi:hypothetical protein